jgi:hypothetical protein
MKKMVLFLSVCFLLGAADAQIVKITQKSISAPDTVVFTNAPSKIKAFQYQYTESSGTTAGKVYFEGTVTGAYVIIDSLLLADVSTAQAKLFSVSSTNYLTYRFRNTNTSSASGTIRCGYLRRADE